MKKLLSVFCSALCIHSISQSPLDVELTQKASGEKVLMKAISVIVNPEGNRKVPVKIATIPPVHCS